ncbi:MAG: hypothetical protein Q8O13_04410 [Candidatus Omnitrophota bacterium]|nr:hypothetical protein [Candidatus Omnitrophota bacterium]
MPQREDNKNLFVETLDWICQKLESADIPYMITGGSAVGFWGYIRTTMDIDILIKIQPKQILSFLKSIEDEAYVDIEEAKRAIFNKEMFNVIMHKTSFKVDIIPLDEKNAYAVEEFKNRVKIRFQDKEIFVISPEDLVISKLIWSKSAGGSERQLKDCESIYALNREKINLDYILKWVKSLELDSEFRKL